MEMYRPISKIARPTSETSELGLLSDISSRCQIVLFRLEGVPKVLVQLSLSVANGSGLGNGSEEKWHI